MNTPTQPSNPSTIPDPPITNLALTILNITHLPSAPTFDWTTQAAKSLAPLHPFASFGVVIAHHNQDTGRLQTESAGVSLAPPNQSTSIADQARCPLDRIGTITTNISQNQQQSGYITTTEELLPSWYQSPLSEPWNSPPNTLAKHRPLAAYAEISNTINTHTNTTLALIVIANLTNTNAGPIDPSALANALAVLTHKAKTTIRRQDSGAVPWLTQREQVILDQLIIGSSVRAIAESIGRSPHTVHDHVKNLHRKLGASSRGQLIAKAIGHQQSTDPITLINPAIDPLLLIQIDTPTHTQAVAEIKPAAPTPNQKQQATPLTPH